MGSIQTCRSCFGSWLGGIRSPCPFCQAQQLVAKVKQLEKENSKTKGEVMSKIQVCKKCFGDWIGTVGSPCPFCHVEETEAKVKQLEDVALETRNYIQDSAQRTQAKIEKLKGKVRQLEASSRHWRDEGWNQKANVEDYKKGVSEKTTEIKRLKGVIVNLHEVINCEAVKVEKQKTEIEQLKDSVSCRRDAASNQEAKIKKLYADIGRLEGVLVNYRASVSYKEIKIQKQVVEIKRLEGVIVNYKTTASYATDRIKKQKTEIERLKVVLNNYRVAANYDEDKVKELNTEIARLKGALKDEVKKSHSLESWIQNNEKLVDQQAVEIKRLKDSTSSNACRLEAKIKELEKTNVALLGQLNSKGSVTLEFQNVTGHQVARIQEIKIKELMTEIETLKAVIQSEKVDARAFKGEGHTPWCRSNSIKIVELEHHHRYMELQLQLKIERLQKDLQDGETLRLWYKSICDKLCILLNVRTPTILPSAVRSLKEKIAFYKDYSFANLYGGK